MDNNLNNYLFDSQNNNKRRIQNENNKKFDFN